MSDHTALTTYEVAEAYATAGMWPQLPQPFDAKKYEARLNDFYAWLSAVRAVERQAVRTAYGWTVDPL